jgi:hypothetical protein
MVCFKHPALFNEERPCLQEALSPRGFASKRFHFSSLLHNTYFLPERKTAYEVNFAF